MNKFWNGTPRWVRRGLLIIAAAAVAALPAEWAVSRAANQAARPENYGVLDSQFPELQDNILTYRNLDTFVRRVEFTVEGLSGDGSAEISYTNQNLREFENNETKTLRFVTGSPLSVGINDDIESLKFTIEARGSQSPVLTDVRIMVGHPRFDILRYLAITLLTAGGGSALIAATGKTRWTPIPKREIRGPSLERIYGILAFSFGVVLLFLVPPMQVADEPHHFFRSMQISEGHLLDSNAAIDQGAREFADRYLYLTFDWNAKIDYRYIFSDRTPLAGVQGEGQTLVPYTLPYLPQVAGLLLGKLLSPNFLPMFYLGRFANLLLGVFLVFQAIRLIPYGKLVVFGIAMLPMAVFQLASISYDSFTISYSLFYISWVLALAESKRPLNRKSILFLFLASAVLFTMKPPYMLLVFMIILLPPERFVSGRRKAAVFASFIAAGLTIVILPGLLRSLLQPESSSIYTENEYSIWKDQLAYVLKHPGRYLLMLLRTTYVRRIHYAKELVGVFGWLDSSLPLWLYWTVLGALAGLVVPFRDRRTPDVLGRIVFAVVFLGIFVGVLTAQYLFWTPVHAGGIGAEVSIGAQGRYFLPFVPLFFLALRIPGEWFPQESGIFKDMSLIFMIVFIPLMTIANIGMIETLLYRYHA